MNATLKIAGSLLATAVIGSMSIAGARAEGSLNGQIGVQLTIGAGCTVGNGDTSSDTNDWGTLDFGEYADLSSVIDGEVLGSNNSSAVTITCSDGLTPSLTLDGGLNGAGSLRNLAAGDTLIPYRLYSDSARSSEITLDGSVNLIGDGSTQSLPVYGRVLPSDQTATPAPAAGSYTDTVVATIAW